MSDVVVDAHEDCRLWQLTPIECVRYEGRLVTYHAQRARRLADESIRYGNLAVAFAVAGWGFTVLAILALAVGALR